MKRFVLLVVALVFALCTIAMAEEPVKVEKKTANIKATADVKAMNKGEKLEKARKDKAINEYNEKSGKGSGTQQGETASSTQSTTSTTKSKSKSDAAYDRCIQRGGTKKECGK